MTFTYDNTLSTNLAKVRFRIGDTDSADPLFTDEEIGALLSSEGSVLKAALACCRSLAARFARKADAAIGMVRENLSQVSKRFGELCGDLESQISAEAEASADGAGATLTGMSISDNAASRDDADRYPDSVYLGRDDNRARGAASDDLT